MPPESDLLRLINEHTDGGPLSDDMADAMSMALKYKDGKVYEAVPGTVTSGAAGSSSPPLTMAAMEAAIKKLKAIEEKKEHTAPEPVFTGDPNGWKMTSVRWLRENYPEFDSAGNAHVVLSTALSRMSYGEAETARPDGSIDRTAAITLRGKLLSTWDREEHDGMVCYLKLGGFSARMLALGKGNKPKARIPDPIVRTSTPPAQSLDDVVRELANPTAGSW